MIGVDSNILIDILRNKENANLLRNYSSEELCTSEMVVYEIALGVYYLQNQKKIEEFKQLLDSFGFIFQIDRRVSLKAAQISANLMKQGKMIEDRDILIAASFLVNGCTTIMTKNKSDFKRIEGLKVL